jgi:hypothetical protein
MMDKALPESSEEVRSSMENLAASAESVLKEKWSQLETFLASDEVKKSAEEARRTTSRLGKTLTDTLHNLKDVIKSKTKNLDETSLFNAWDAISDGLQQKWSDVMSSFETAVNRSARRKEERERKREAKEKMEGTMTKKKALKEEQKAKKREERKKKRETEEMRAEELGETFVKAGKDEVKAKGDVFEDALVSEKTKVEPKRSWARKDAPTPSVESKDGRTSWTYEPLNPSSRRNSSDKEWSFERARSRKESRDEAKRGDWWFERQRDRQDFHELREADWHSARHFARRCKVDEDGVERCEDIGSLNDAAINHGTGGRLHRERRQNSRQEGSDSGRDRHTRQDYSHGSTRRRRERKNDDWRDEERDEGQGFAHFAAFAGNHKDFNDDFSWSYGFHGGSSDDGYASDEEGEEEDIDVDVFKTLHNFHRQSVFPGQKRVFPNDDDIDDDFPQRRRHWPDSDDDDDDEDRRLFGGRRRRDQRRQHGHQRQSKRPRRYQGAADVGGGHAFHKFR